MKRFLRGITLSCAAWLVYACSVGMTEAEYIAKAEEYLGKEEFQAASIEVKNALKQNPDNPRARWLLGKIHLETGDTEAAEKELLRARELGVVDELTLPLLARSLILQGKHEDIRALSLSNLSAEAKAVVLASQGLSLLSQGKLEEAGPHIDKALSLAPQLAYGRVAKARLLALKRDYGSARNELNDVLQHTPVDALAWSLLGDIELREQQLGKADEAYTSAIEHRTNNLADRLKRVLVRIQLKRYDQAKKELDVLKKRNPRHAGVHFAQGLIDYKNDRFPEAQNAFEQAVNNNGRYLPAIYFLSLTHLRQGNLEQAEHYGNEFLVASPESFPGRKLMARINLANQQYEKAEDLVRPLARLNDKDVVALNLLSNALLKQGKTDEAIELLQKVASLQPNSPVAQLRLGTGLLAVGEQITGVEHIETALGLDPQFQQADILLILNFLKQKDLEKALAAAQAYRDRNPDHSTPYNLIGRIYLASGQLEQAEKTFSQALDLVPGDPAASQSMAALALKSEDFDKARYFYREVLKYHENHLTTLLKLAALDALEKKEQSMIGHLQQAIAAHPEAPQPRLVLARYYLSKGKADQVPALLNELDELQRKGPEVLSVMALSQLARKIYSEAKFTLEQLVDLQPKLAQAHYWLAQANAGLNDRKGMQAELEIAIELTPEYLPARLALTRMLLSDGRKDAAEEQLKVLREFVPEQADVLHLEASLASLNGDQQAALVKFEQAFDKSPSTSRLLILTRQRWGMGDREGAIRLQEQWIREHPNEVAAQLALADMYILENRVDEAVKQYRAVLDSENKNLVALNNLSWQLRDTQPQQSLDYATRANNIAPESAALMDTLAVVLLKNGEVEKARRTITRALEKEPENPAMHYHSAMIEVAAGERVSALKTLTALLAEDTDFPEKAEAEQLLEKLQTGG